MNRIGYSAMSGMNLEARRQEIIANNIAAANVPGYKAEFLLSSPNKGSSGDSVTGVSGGAIKVDFSQGTLKNTGRQLDFALQGEGFFKVKTTDNKFLYTRNGAFTLDEKMTLVTDQGFQVVDDTDNPIIFLPDDNTSNLEVKSDGTLTLRGTLAEGFVYRDIAKLAITHVENKEDMERLTGSYFRMAEGKTAKAPEEPEVFHVSNCRLETSNVSPVKSMVQMIQSSREFEMGSRVMKMLSDMSSKEERTFGT